MIDDYVKMTAYPIFRGFSPSDIERFVASQPMRRETYAPDTIIVSQGSVCREMGLIIHGSCVGEIYTVNGDRSIIAQLSEGGVFADIVAMSESGVSPVTVSSVTETTVLFIPYEKLHSGGCAQNALLLGNLASIISEKYFALLFRVNCLSKPTLKEKILYYLRRIPGSGSRPFTVPFDRRGLADFLATDRSSLSRELSRLKADGIIDYHKNTFRLTDGSEERIDR